jgi:hypothetical protein
MSTQKLSNKELTSIDAEQILEFLTEKKVSSMCDQCNSPSSTLFVGEDNKPVITNSSLTNHANFVQDSYRNPCFVIFCSNCGHERHFSAGIIYRGIMEKDQDNG